MKTLQQILTEIDEEALEDKIRAFKRKIKEGLIEKKDIEKEYDKLKEKEF